MFVYVITNAVNGKIYVGQHKGADLQHYLQQKFYEAEHRLKARSILYAAIRKHGHKNFSIEPLAEVHGDVPKTVLDSLEQFCILFLDTRNPEIGYNICRGGEGFTGPHTEEWKRNAQERLNRYWDTRKQNLTGQTFGRLTVQSEAEKSKKGTRLWNCLCVCGNFTITAMGDLKSGQTKSCGCLLAETGRRHWANLASAGLLSECIKKMKETKHRKHPPMCKTCPVCHQQFSVLFKFRRRICCSKSCEIKRRWQDPQYRAWQALSPKDRKGFNLLKTKD